MPIVCDKEIVADPQPVYRSLPRELVTPLSYPPGLPQRFTILDTLDLVYHLYDTIDLANEDRATAGRIVKGESRDGDISSTE